MLGVDLATIHQLAVNVEPYIRADGTPVWSLIQLERQLRPEAFHRRRGGYIDRRRDRTFTVAAASAVAHDSAWHEQQRVIGSWP